MHLSPYGLALLSLGIYGALADYLTPTYPAPIDLSSDKSLVAAAWQNLSSQFDNYLSGRRTPASGDLSGAENVTFSIGMFSLHDIAAAQLQYHHTAPEIAKAQEGTNKVDGNSIYRVASVSKLITTFAGLVEMTEKDWNRPLADIIPGLGRYDEARAKGLNPIYTTQWDKITPWALASQLSGIATIGYPGGDLAVEAAIAIAEVPDVLEIYGVPPVNVSALGSCATNIVNDPATANIFCPASAGVKAVEGLAPNFLSWTTPAYSDLGM